jgi:hypothetical protein
MMRCHFCGEQCNPFLRHDFLRRGDSKGKFRW